MKYELPKLPGPEMITFNGDDYGDEVAKEIWYYTDDQMRQYAEQAVAPLLEEIDRLGDKIYELQLQIEQMQD